VQAGKHVEERAESKNNKQEEPKTLGEEEAKVDLNKLPKPMEHVWERAQEIAEEHNALAAFYFLLYTLLGAEAAGFLL